jgi:ArsR family transcriptional regulator
MAATLRRLEQLKNELSLAQRWVQGRLSDVRERVADEVGDADPRLVTDLLAALTDDRADTESLSRTVDAPPPVVEDVLEHLASRGVVVRDGGVWRLGDQ